MKKLINEIDKIIKNSNEKISIIIKDIDSSEYIYCYNSEIRMVAASTIKILIMLTVLEEVRKNKIQLDEKILVTKNDILKDSEVFENDYEYYTIYELINWMIIKSDNTATNIILKLIGISKVNDYIRKELNLKSTYLERYMLDVDAIQKGFNNYTSQEDMLKTFTNLFNKSILNDELCDMAIKILYNQRCQDQVMRYIYEPIKYAHKTGSLDYLNHDVGVMNINNKNFYIGISIYKSKNMEGNKKLVGILGKMIYEYLNKKYL